jgi:hypothetical protein
MQCISEYYKQVLDENVKNKLLVLYDNFSYGYHMFTSNFTYFNMRCGFDY